MKKYLFMLLLVVAALGAQGQNRKQIAQFSLFQQYFNPALTGFEGSQVKTFFRDQFTGFSDAPRTLFVSGELNLADLAAPAGGPAVQTQRQLAAKNAVGVSLLRDTFGPFQETHFNLSYGSQVRLSEQLSLRAGAGMSYEVSRLDASKITMDDVNDPEYQNLYGTDNNQTHKLDLTAGLTLSGQNFYAGYALHNLAQGQLLAGDHYFDNTFPLHHVMQAGYRKSLSDKFGLVFNGLYRYDKLLKESVEGQLKGVWNNTFWAGAGYRHDLAWTFQAGLRVSQFRLGYGREITAGKANGFNNGTNELMITYFLTRIDFAKASRVLSVW